MLNNSWHVRGHWRKVATIGHDREGKPMPGFTWVRPHVRGEGPLKEKPYIVKGA